MIRTYDKGALGGLVLGLTQDEFKCRCTFEGCTMTLIDIRLLDAYENFRRTVGYPLTILSGYRCPQHNYCEGGGRTSQHPLGRAIDVAYLGEVAEQYTPEEFEASARLAGFTWVKYYEKKKFFHLDTRR